MIKRWNAIAILILLMVLLREVSPAIAADGYYQLSEAIPMWDGTIASRLTPATSEYDYTYGDDESITYSLPWTFQFYGRNYSSITADTNGNVWFVDGTAAYDINLASTGRGPVISAWNKDLSSSYYGGVFIEHKANPERVVIEWNSETYSEEGYYSPNSVAVVLYPDGTVRFDYKSFSTEIGSDSGSGISRGDGSASTSLTSQFGNVFMLAGRSFQFTPEGLYPVTVIKDGLGSGTITSDISGINCGTICSGNFPSGTSLVLTAKPNFGSEFDAWTGSCAGSNPCNVTVDGSTNITASFKETYAPLVIIDSPSGPITKSSPALSYQVSTGTVVVKVDGVVVNKVSGDALEALADGEHLLRVEATNGAGHMGFAESSFFVDTTPPAVTKVTPVSGSGSVPVRMSVLVEFAEQIDAASVAIATMSLESQWGAVPGEIRLSSDGRGLIFKPQDKLSYAASYTFTLKAGVRDLLGNATISDLTTTFTTPMVDPDLVGYWPMDGDWKDYSGYGDDGVGYGTSIFDNGRIPGVRAGSFAIDSALFPGSGGFVYTPAKFIATPGNFTMSFWAKPTATRESTAESNQNVVDGRGVQRFAIAPVNFYNLGYLGASAGVSVGTNGISVIEETTVVDGAILRGYMPALLVYDSPTPLTGWNHVAVVYNNKQPSLYLNGTLVRTGLVSNQYQVYPAALFAYGNERETGSYSGQLEGIAIHGRALTGQEIQALYQTQSKSVPQISISSPGKDVMYRAGEVGNATISVTSATGIAKVYCSATGATSFGGLAVEYEQPQAEISQQFNFQVATDAPPSASILLSCVAQTAEGTLGVGQLELNAADLAPPTVSSSTPANNAIDVSATMPITIYFSEAVDPASLVSHDTFRFERSDNGAWASSMYRFSSDNKAMQIMPSPALDGGTSYTITLGRLRDLAGNVMAADFTLQFTTLQQTNLAILDQGTAASPYVLPTGRYGTVAITNSYVSVAGGVAADTLNIDHSTLNLSTSVSIPGDLSVAFGDLNLANGSELIVSGSVDVAGNLNMNGSTMAVTGIGAVGGNVVSSSSSITLKNSLQVSGGVVLQDNSVLTHFAATKTDTSKLDVIAAYMTVDATSKIDVAGKGYIGGYPEAVVPGAISVDAFGYTLGNTLTGGSWNGSGGSNGGHGGGTQPNVAYGDVANPNELGSGGGGLYYDLFTGIEHVITRIAGGNGGGLIRLNVGSLNLDGAITANGAATAASGGSGGSIYINAATLSGTGTISAKGGTAGDYGGGGGGGRIAIYYGSNNISSASISATGGGNSDGSTADNGGAGTVYLKAASLAKGDVIVDNSGLATSSKTMLAGGDYGQLTVRGGAIASVSGDISSDQDVILTGSTLTSSGGITSTGSLTLDGSTLSANGPVNITNALTLKNGSLLTHSAATGTVSYKLDVTAETITLNDTSKIDVSGRGFLGGLAAGNTDSKGMTFNPVTQGPTTTGGSNSGAGGSYGGLGGNGVANASYGDSLQPKEPGSGGGANGYVGANGGGVVKLTANVLSLTGAGTGILANGSDSAANGGGGSGGAIWINAGTLSGIGTISAKGGGAGSYGGGGGGGRIGIYYDVNPSTVSITATGGRSANGAARYNGADGTIYLYQHTLPLSITKASSGFGTVQSTPSGIFCGAICNASFGKTSNVTLTAVPEVGSTFKGWSGACGGTGVCTVTMDMAKTVTASFALIPPTVSISSPVGVTNNRPLLQFTVSAGTVVVKVDGVVVGNVSGELLDLPVDGTHTIRVEATSNGVTGYAESIFTVDTVAPTLTVNTLPTIVKVATQMLSGTMETGSSVSLTVTAGTATLGSVTYPTSTTWRCTASNLSAGTNVFAINAHDEAGNSSGKSLSLTYVLPLALELSTPSIAATYEGSLTLSVSNIAPAGSRVLVEQLVDINGNRIVDSGDYPVRIFTVSDGVAAANPKTQGDEDAANSGAIATTLAFGLPSGIYHAPGSYLFRVTNDTETATASFDISPDVQLQSVTGTVTDGTNPVAGAIVRLLDKWKRSVGWTIADETGHYTLYIPTPGEYLVTPVAYGFVAAPGGAPLTILADQNITDHNLVLTAGTVHLSGKITKAQSSDPVVGVWVQALGANAISSAITGADGSYDLWLPADQYDVAAVADATMPNPAGSGCLANVQFEHVNLQVDTTGVDLTLIPADVVVSGTVFDQNGSPAGGMPILGQLAASVDVREPVAFAITDQTGNYTLALAAGSDWTIKLHDAVAQPLGFVGNAIRNFSTDSVLADNNLSAWPVTAVIKGTVVDSNFNPLGDVDVQLRNADSSIVMHLHTADDGSYRFGTYGGDWYLSAYPGPEQMVTTTDGQISTVDVVVGSVPP